MRIHRSYLTPQDKIESVEDGSPGLNAGTIGDNQRAELKETPESVIELQ